MRRSNKPFNAPDAHVIAASIRSRETSALDVLQETLDRIEASNPVINAFTEVTVARARETAAGIDRRLDRGDPALATLPLLGVPYAVKNLFDVRGLKTLAGSRIEQDAAPATRDAVLVDRLNAAGAVLVGTLNMDEYAYGFTTENSHYGPSRNPHDPTRIAGGSSGGSAAAVAAGAVPLTLGSDTNGSIRVPASLCGIYGLKPTFGRLPRSGTYPFVHDLDHLGPFSRSVTDLALAYDAMQGFDPGDASCARRSVEPLTGLVGNGITGLRFARLGGYFTENADATATAATELIARHLGAVDVIELEEVDRARAAAFLITNAQGASMHLDNLRSRPQDFEPLSRDRFLAGALLPAQWIERAQQVRHWFARHVAQALVHHDVLLAPATPCVATPIGTEWIEINGRRMQARPSMGVLTQPISCIGLPVCVVPVHGIHPHLPIGVQLIAAPWREDLVIRTARFLEEAGICSAPIARAPEPGAPSTQR